eukprot:SAG31_NODE_3633_length_4043_cov_5.462982_2_plen_109_part_00
MINGLLVVPCHRELSDTDPDDVLLLNPPLDAVDVAAVKATMQKAKLLQKLSASLQLLDEATGKALARQRLADHARRGGCGHSGLLEWGTADRDIRCEAMPFESRSVDN